MGSFRIVAGSGYGRREFTSGEELVKAFDRLKTVAEKKSSPSKVVAKSPSAKKAIETTVRLRDKIWEDTVKRANKWARETAAEMRSKVPVDTGNLKESIHILKDECYQNKASGEIIMVVGVNLDPAGGQYKLYAPPYRKKGYKGRGASRYGRKRPPWKGYRLMPSYDPSYPGGYASKWLGEDGVVVSNSFKAIARKNAKKIMGK